MFGIFIISLLGGAVKPVLGAMPTMPLTKLNTQLGSLRKAVTVESEVPDSWLLPVKTSGIAALDLRLPDNNKYENFDDTFWPPEEGNGLVAWIFAAIFVVMIASMPVLLHFMRDKATVSLLLALEGISIVVWLCFGLICFTQLVKFQSPHFGGDVRSLTLVEAVYLFSQILTTVGYGDITPANASGQACVGIFVIISIILIAELMSELFTIVCERAEKAVMSARGEVSSQRSVDSADGKKTLSTYWWSLGFAALLFLLSVLIGTCFFHLYPGEGKTWGQGVYMSIITLTTVGFGAYHAETQAGMVFGAFWMVLGVTALGYLVSAFSELSMAYRERREHQHETPPQFSRMEPEDEPASYDAVSFLQYMLVTNDEARTHEIDIILKQFRKVSDGKGTISIERLKGMPELPIGHHHHLHHHAGLHAAHHVH